MPLDYELLFGTSCDNKMFCFEHCKSTGSLTALSGSTKEWCRKYFETHENLTFWIVDLIILMSMNYPAQHGMQWILVEYERLIFFDNTKQINSTYEQVIILNQSITKVMTNRCQSILHHEQCKKSNYAVVGKRIDRWNNSIYDASRKHTNEKQFESLCKYNWIQYIYEPKIPAYRTRKPNQQPNFQICYWLNRQLIRKFCEEKNKNVHSDWITSVHCNLDELSNHLGQIVQYGDLILPKNIEDTLKLKYGQSLCSKTMIGYIDQKQLENLMRCMRQEKIVDSQNKKHGLTIQLNDLSLDDPKNLRHKIVEMVLKKRITKLDIYLLYAVFSRMNRYENIGLEPQLIKVFDKRFVINSFEIKRTQFLCAFLNGEEKNEDSKEFYMEMQEKFPTLDKLEGIDDYSGDPTKNDIVHNHLRCDAPIIQYGNTGIYQIDNQNVYVCWVTEMLLTPNEQYSKLLN